MPAGKIYSFKTMRDQVLSAIRATGDATMITNVNAWLNEQALEYGMKWNFPDLISKFRTTISVGAQKDTILPLVIRNVPRDMVKLLEAKLLDESVSPIEWHPIQIRSMNEFERKFYNTDLKDSPGIPSEIALFIQESSVFPGGGDFSYAQGFESLTAGIDLDTQDLWAVTAPNFSVGTVTTTNPIRGVQAVSFDAIDNPAGFPYRRDVDVTTRSIFRAKIRRPTGMSDQVNHLMFVSNGLDPGVIASRFDTSIPWRMNVSWFNNGQLAFGPTVDGVDLTGQTVQFINTDADAEIEAEIDSNALVIFRLNGVTVATGTTVQPTINRIHFNGNRTSSTGDDAVLDDLVYEDSTEERLHANGIQVRSTDSSEATTLKAGANVYTTIGRTRIEKFETSTQPVTAGTLLSAKRIYQVIGLGKSEFSKGIIIFETNDIIGILIGELMPWETSATFLTLQLDPFTDATYELHLTYKRSPPIMVNDSDTTFLLPSLLQGAIIEGAIVRGLKYNEDFQAAAAAAAIQRQKEAEFVVEYFPELIEEAHTFISI